MMKKINIIYKLLLLLPLISLISCDNNDDMVDVITQTTTTTENAVFIETDDAAETTTLMGIGESQSVIVGVNNMGIGDSTISFTVTKDGTAAVEGTDYTIADAIILASEMEGSSDITFLTKGFYEVSIKSTSNSSLNIVENRLLYLVPSQVNYIFTWDDSFYDYDVFIFDALDPDLIDLYDNGLGDIISEVYGYSGGFTTTEGITASMPVGDAYIYIEDYWNDNNIFTNTQMTIQIDGLADEVFDVEIDTDKYIIKIETKLNTDGTDVEYVFTQL
jgi:hypothetical protein